MGFDKAMLLKMFPNKTEADIGRGGCELNGLDKNSVPRGEILGEFEADKKDRRTFYMVKIEERVAVIRVCSAGELSDYEEFAVLHFTSNEIPEEDVKKKFFQWKSAMSV